MNSVHPRPAAEGHKMGRNILIASAVILLFVFFILTSWVRITLIYSQSPEIYIQFLFFRFSPLSKKSKNIRLGNYSIKALRKKRFLFNKRLRANAKKAGIKKEKSLPEKRKIADLTHLMRYYFRLVLILLKRFGRSLRIDIYRLVITVASGDAAATAILYGAVSGLTADLLSLCGQYRKIKYKKNAQTGIQADFIGEKWSFDLHLVLRARLYHFISLALRAFMAYLNKQ